MTMKPKARRFRLRLGEDAGGAPAPVVAPNAAAAPQNNVTPRRPAAAAQAGAAQPAGPAQAPGQAPGQAQPSAARRPATEAMAMAAAKMREATGAARPAPATAAAAPAAAPARSPATESPANEGPATERPAAATPAPPPTSPAQPPAAARPAASKPASGTDLEVTYVPDALHRLRAMIDLSILNNAVTIAEPLMIDYFGYRRQRKLLNVVSGTPLTTLEYGYDAKSRLTSMEWLDAASGPLVAGFEYAYNKVDVPQWERWLHDESRYDHFTHDDLDQVTGVFYRSHTSTPPSP